MSRTPQELFNDEKLADVLAERREILRDEIDGVTSSDFFARTEEAWRSSFETRFAVTPVCLQIDRSELATPREVQAEDTDSITKQCFPCTKLELRLEIPFTGEAELFRYQTEQHYLDAPRGIVDLERKTLVLVTHTDDQDPARVRKLIDATIQSIADHLRFQEAQLTKWNQKVSGDIPRWIASRSKKLNADKILVAALGFNIRRHDRAPATCEFPLIQKTIQVPPLKPAQIPALDPAITARINDEILKILEDMSVAIERSQSTFADIGEEALRDWFLVALNGHFRGDATGETFNREGKADISIRANGSVIFIAECKFWGGEKVLLETIDQLLGYLTWRDSKAALLVFSRNADFSAVLGQIPGIVGKHPHSRGTVSKHGESGFRFHLRDKTDPDRQHLVTLLAFNVPRIKPTSAA